MKITIHKADTRGHADHGWLKAYHTFSFGRYVDRNRLHFGALRVLNDDTVAGGAGFGTHPHDNMEIVTIPLRGAIAHKDSMGNGETLPVGEVQIMSAGSGLTHSEYNPNPDQDLNLLQIWVLPKLYDIKPQYDQRAFLAEDRKNKFQLLVGPTAGDNLEINQDAYFSRIDTSAATTHTYKLNQPNNGVYVFTISGDVMIGNTALSKRDAAGFEEISEITIKTIQDAELLLIEVPMIN